MRRLADLQERGTPGRFAGSDRPTSFGREMSSAWIGDLLNDAAAKIERELEKRGFDLPAKRDIAGEVWEAMVEGAVSVVDKLKIKGEEE